MAGIVTASERRRATRRRVLRSGKIFLGFSAIAIDCLIWDESPRGLLAETKVPTAVPERVKIKINDVGTFYAIRRWVIGDFIGFEFIGDQTPKSDVAKNETEVEAPAG
jgi:hypothetical protein